MTFTVSGEILTQAGDDGNTTATDLTTRGLDGLFGTTFQNVTESFTATAGQTEFTVTGTRATGVTVAGASVPFTQRIIANGLRIEIAAATAGQEVVVTFNIVDRHFDGNVAVYTLAPGLRFDVTGTLTINPEIERLIVDDPVGLQVLSSGRLNLGKELTKSGFTRNSKGVAVYFSNAPAVWFGLGGGGPGSTNASRLGLGTNFRILTGGELFWRGAEVRGTVSLGCTAGSSVRIIDGTMTVFDAPSGTTDPRTGSNVTTGNGLFENGGNIPAVSRGFITWINTTDIAVDGLTVCNGGEIGFVLEPSGTNTLDTTAQNGIRGYSPVNTAIGTFPNRTDTQSFTDSSIGGNGNIIDVTIQSEESIEVGNGARTNPTVTTITNERAGTNLVINGGEGGTNPEPRNFGTVVVTRNFNIDASSLANASAEINGGRYFIRDTDNGFRTNLNGRDDTDDYVYSGVLTANSIATDAQVLLGAVKLSSSPPKRRSQFTPVNLPSAGNIYAIDLRGKAVAPATAAVIGDDLFDAHYWHTDYQYFVQEVDLSDGTVGTFEMTANLATDLNYQTADFAVAGEISTLDELYKAEKLRKVATATDVEEPSIGSLYTVASDSNIDIGALPLTINQTATERYEATHSGMTAGAIMTASFNTGGVTRVGGSNATLSNEATSGQPVGDGEVVLTSSFSSLFSYTFFHYTGNDWSGINGIYLDVDSPGASGIANTTNPILVYVDSNNYALYVPGVGTAGDGTVISRQLGAIALNSDGEMITAGSPPGDGVAVTVVYGPQAMLYQEGMTIPAGLEIGSTAFTAGSIFTGLVTTNTVNQGGLAVDYDLTAGTITGLPTSGEIITENGAITGGVALAAGSYTINGDASGAVFTRSGSTGTVTLTFGSSAVRPASITDPNVEAPFILRVDSRTDANGRLSVYRNGVLLNPSDVNPATYSATGTSAGTDDFVIVYTAPGRTDFRLAVDNLSTDRTEPVTTEANPFPALPTDANAPAPNDLIGPSAATFTANPDPLRPNTGIITIINDNEWKRSAAFTNFAIQRLVKGSEVYNNIVRVSTLVNGVTSLGGNSTAQVNGTIVTFVSTSPKSIGFVQQDGSDPLFTLTEGRFFTPGSSRGAAGVWSYDRTAGVAPTGTFTYNASSNVLNISDIDSGGTNRSSTLASSNIRNGDYMIINDSSNDLVTQAVVASDTDDSGNVQHRFVFNSQLENVSSFSHGDSYSIEFFDTMPTNIDVGVTILGLAGFDPGVTGSQIAGAVTSITADIGTTVDAELRRGAITNVGRPPLA